jgi:AraC-like DNA-binding protein
VTDRRTIWAREPQQFLAFVGARHPRVIVGPLAAAAGLPDLAERAPEARVPIARVWALWQAAADATGDRALAVRYGLAARLEDLGLLGFALVTAPTTREALARTTRFLHLVTDSARMDVIERGGTASVRWVRDGARGVGLALANETVLAQLVAMLHQGIGRRAVTELTFRHAAPAAADAATIARLVGARVRWGAAHDQVGLPAAALDAVSPGANASMSAYFVDQIAAREPASVAAQVAAAVGELLGDGEPDARVVAERLAMSDRTLRRALAREQTSFRAVVDDVRGRRAEALLADRRHSLTEIAFALGFAEHSAFTRAFKRWFGVAPARYRRGA